MIVFLCKAYSPKQIGADFFKKYLLVMGNLHYRPNFIPGKINKIFYHSSKEHFKISRIAKFGGEML